MAEMFPNAQAEGAAGAAIKDDYTDLGSQIDKSGCYGKNESRSHPVSNLFIGDSLLGCKSDTDEQLIIHIAFKDFVKIKAIKLSEYNNGIDPESNPSKIHLFVNRENIGFEDWEDFEPTQTLHLTADKLKDTADPIPLKFVRFQRVKSITFFVEDNQGGEITAIGGLKILGWGVETTNMSDFKKNPNATE